MTGTAQDLFEGLSEALGMKPAGIEPYGLRLREFGVWPPTKRGRGALPMTDMDGAKLLLSVLSDGPRQVHEFFLEYANMTPMLHNRAVLAAVQEVLGLDEDAYLLDYIAGLVRLYRKGEIEQLVYWRPSDPGHLDDFVFDGPNCDVSIQGPYPVGQISFHLAIPLVERLVRQGHDRDEVTGPQTIAFLHQLFHWQRVAEAKGEDTAGYDDAIDDLRRARSKGIRFQRTFGGREFTAIAKALTAAEEAA